MPYANDFPHEHTLYVYQEPLKNVHDEPYYMTTEYKREDMVLVMEVKQTIAIPSDWDPIEGSIRQHNEIATSLEVLARQHRVSAENLLAIEHDAHHTREEPHLDMGSSAESYE